MTRVVSLQQPLVIRPAYGQAGLPSAVSIGGVPIQEYARTKGLGSGPVAESGLPKGDPGGKGIKLDKDIPGESTFDKPEEDVRQFDKTEPGSIYRIDGPDDMARPQDQPDGDERHHEDFKPRIEPEDSKPTEEITKYPYRDGLPHQHFASEQNEFVVGLYLAERAHTLKIVPGNRVLVATRPDEVITGLNPQFAQRAKSCSVSMKRADIGNLRWLFSVNCGNGPKVVKLKAFRAANVVRIGKMDVDLACSCPAWQWLGPEHHAKGNDYLDGSPRGTASTPVIRDPQGINRVCKHVAAVLSFVQDWQVKPTPKKK